MNTRPMQCALWTPVLVAAAALCLAAIPFSEQDQDAPPLGTSYGPGISTTGESSLPEQWTSELEAGEVPGLGISETFAEDDSSLEQLENGSVVVYNHTQLEQALKSADITVICLGTDIQLTGGMEINTQKSSLVLDGADLQNPAKLYTLTEHNASGDADVMYLLNSTGLTDITLRNMIIQGRNHYGPVTVRDGAQGVTITYDNIEYSGPQLTFNRHGTARYKDSKITIGRFNGISGPGEVGEVPNVIFEGEVFIRQEDAQANEIFYISERAGSIEVLEGANVEVHTKTESGFIHLTRDVTMKVRKNAVFSYTGPMRFWEAVPLKGLTVEQGGEFRAVVTENLQNTLVRVDGPVLVEEGALLQLENRSTSAYPALLLNGGSLVLDNPRSVLLYAPRIRPLHYLTGNSFSSDTQQVNYWSVADSGGFGDLPLYGWRRENGGNLTLLGTVSGGDSGNFTQLTSNYTDGDLPLNTPPTPDTMNLVRNRVLALGRLEVFAQTRTVGEEQVIWGTTEAGAAVRASYVDDNSDIIYLGDALADQDGAFTIPFPQEPLPPEALVTVEAGWNYLYATTTLYHDLPLLGFRQQPRGLLFQTTPISPRTSLVRRVDGDWGMSVVDTRGPDSTWRLLVRLESPLAPAYGNAPPMEDALVFIAGDGSQHTLTPVDIPVYSHTSQAAPDTTELLWDAGHGPLVLVQPGAARADVPYTGSLVWTLEDSV